MLSSEAECDDGGGSYDDNDPFFTKFTKNCCCDERQSSVRATFAHEAVGPRRAAASAGRWLAQGYEDGSFFKFPKNCGSQGTDGVQASGAEDIVFKELTAENDEDNDDDDDDGHGKGGDDAVVEGTAEVAQYRGNGNKTPMVTACTKRRLEKGKDPATN